MKESTININDDDTIIQGRSHHYIIRKIDLGRKKMFENITKAQSDALDEILKARHTVRAFSSIPPEKKDIEQIIRAGLIAPFASIPAKGKTDFRKIIVIPADSDAMKKVYLAVERVSPNFMFLDKMKKLAGDEPSTQKSTQPIQLAKLLGNAPYLLIAAERKGFPPTYMIEQSISLSYCMYNMWLKAMSLKIGFRLVSAFVHMKLGNDNQFCDELGIPCGEYAIDACAIGYPDEKYKPPHVNYPEYESNTIWL